MTVALALALCEGGFTRVPSSQSASSETITARVDQLFAQLDKPDTPGCALAVIKDGPITYKRGYGTAKIHSPIRRRWGVSCSGATVRAACPVS